MAKAITLFQHSDADLTAPLRVLVVSGFAMALIMAGNVLPY